MAPSALQEGGGDRKTVAAAAAAGEDEDDGMASRRRRVLAKVVRLEQVTRHPCIDGLNVARIGGWDVVVAADEVPGTLGVFFEIDSVLPKDQPWVQALRMPSKCNYSVRSVYIRGCLSQGLFASMSKLPLSCSSSADEETWLRCRDVTALLGVVQRFELTETTFNPQKTPYSTVFPDGPSKTDELRVQSYLELLDEMMGKPYYITVKIDGMSATYGYDEAQGGLCACSRNYAVDIDNTVIGELGKMYHLHESLKEHPNLVIQGEVYGPTVNKNLLQCPIFKLAVFNVYDKKKGKRLPFAEMVEACRMLGLQMVPLEEVGDCFQYSMDELIEKAKGFYLGTQNFREGLVVRCQQQYSDNEYLSFKVINNQYLIKHGQ